jgi:glutamate-5-semialdehyde dehydrogenase
VIEKVRVPFGVIAIIYEARPNVTADAAALCVKSGNAVILRGGKEAIDSNIAVGTVLSDALESIGLPKDCIQVVSDTSSETANKLMTLKGGIDLLIPRGGKSLIRSVVENATVPVIETGAGNCHIYFDSEADETIAIDVIDNAKRSRPSVCNAAETLLVHESVASKLLPLVRERLDNVELRGCERTCALLPDIKSATDEDFFTEYNDYILAVKVVSSLEEAVDHINRHGTGHSEAIITKNTENAKYFTDNIDAAAVYVNASTRFTDGEEFGFGAEIGISTQKMHARGPMGLSEMTTYKYLVKGNGQIR